MGSDAETGRRLGTTITKITKTTKKTYIGFFVIFVAFVVFVSERAPSAVAPSAVAAQVPQVSDAWPQFRGNARLTGVTSASVPATLALKWTYEGGESFESSPAVVDGVVYAGAGSGD